MRRRYGFLWLRSYDDAKARLVRPQRLLRHTHYEGPQHLETLEKEMREGRAGQEGFWLEEPAACEMPLIHDDTIYGIFPRLPLVEDPADLMALVQGVWVDAPRAALPTRIRPGGCYLIPRDS
jgi:hypothetical protein